MVFIYPAFILPFRQINNQLKRFYFSAANYLLLRLEFRMNIETKYQTKKRGKTRRKIHRWVYVFAWLYMTFISVDDFNLSYFYEYICSFLSTCCMFLQRDEIFSISVYFASQKNQFRLLVKF